MNRHFSKEDREMHQQAHTKMLSFTNYQRNASQNHSELLLPHTCQNDSHQSLQIINAG